MLFAKYTTEDYTNNWIRNYRQPSGKAGQWLAGAGFPVDLVPPLTGFVQAGYGSQAVQ